MFKGIVALFTSGLFFHPMVLSGIVAAIAAIMKLQNDQIYDILRTSYLYIGAFVYALLYTFIFAKIYHEGGEYVNKSATFLKAIGNTIRLLLAFILTFSFAILMSF